MSASPTCARRGLISKGLLAQVGLIIFIKTENCMTELIWEGKDRGEEPDKPFTGHFTVRLSPDQHRQVVLAAEKAGKKVDS